MAYAYEPGAAQPRKGADQDGDILKEFKVSSAFSLPFPIPKTLAANVAINKTSGSRWTATPPRLLRLG